MARKGNVPRLKVKSAARQVERKARPRADTPQLRSVSLPYHHMLMRRLRPWAWVLCVMV